MGQQIFLQFLFLCTFLSCGFASLISLPNNETTDSLDHLVRQKRVIDTASYNSRVRRLEDVSYIVQIQRYLVHVCAGSILSLRVILTLAGCVREHARYSVQSGTLSRTGGSIHDVNGILIHPQYAPNYFSNNLALLSIEQPIILGQNLHQPITLYNSNNGILPVRSTVTVSGWGLAVQHRNVIGRLNLAGPPRLIQPSELRYIKLKTISIDECRARHQNDPRITTNDELLCTFHDEKHTGPRDNGDPLVFGGHLAGVLVSYGFLTGPDVYVNVGLPAHRQWILGHMNRIPRYVQPPHRAPNPPPIDSPPRRHNHRRPQTCSLVHPCNSNE